MIEIAGWVVACMIGLMWWFGRSDDDAQAKTQAALRDAERADRDESDKEPAQVSNLEAQLVEAQGALERRERESVKRIDLAIDSFARALLPVDTALAGALQAGGEVDEYRKGVELVQKLLRDAFQENGLELIHPEEGSPFDPEHHHCLMREHGEGSSPDAEAFDAEAWEVSQVVRSGWLLNGRLLHASEVTVRPQQSREGGEGGDSLVETDLEEGSGGARSEDVQASSQEGDEPQGESFEPSEVVLEDKASVVESV